VCEEQSLGYDPSVLAWGGPQEIETWYSPTSAFGKKEVWSKSSRVMDPDSYFVL
jgi:hypothetical protein